MDTLLQDIRFGLRTLLRSPGFTAIAVIALALGIGANTAIFSVINSVILRPLGYYHPDRLVKVMGSNLTRSSNSPVSASYPNFVDWKEQNHVFTDMAAYFQGTFNLTGTGEPQQLNGVQASANLFSLLGVNLKLGRTFSADEDKPKGAKAAILSYELWRNRFGSDPDIVGKSITIDGENTPVVGVMPPGFNLVHGVDIWLPLALDVDQTGRLNLFLDTVGRMKDGVQVDQARAEMKTIAARLAEQYPPTNKNWTATVTPLLDDIVGDMRARLYVLLGAVGFVLLIACANVANLLLARASVRQKEISVRLALGAPRTRIVRQLLTESVILSVCGGALGLLMAVWGVSSLSSLSKNLPRVDEINVDLRVLAFTFLISLMTGLVFGIVPALQASKTDLNETLKDGTKGSSGASHNRLRSILVVTEIALSLVLLIGSGLLIRSFRQLVNVNPGFNEEHVLTFDLTLPQNRYGKPEQQSMFIEQVQDHLKHIAGIESVGATSAVPLAGNNAFLIFYIDGRPARGPEDYTAAIFDVIGPGYFQTMGTPLLKGRDFTEMDRQDAQRVVIISESMARKYFPTEDPLGKQMKLGARPSSPNPWMTIIGVVADVKQTGLAEKEGEVTMYLPYLQQPQGYSAFVVRGRGNIESLVGSIRGAIQSIDKDQPIADIKTMDQLVGEYVSENRFYMFLLTIFSGIALLLAAVGIYGVMSYSVTQRKHEIGIRMAIGAKPMDVLKLVVGQGMLLSVIGIAIGIGIGIVTALTVKSFVSGFLFQVNAIDPTTFVIIPVVIAVVCFLATYLPARRGMRVDPMIAMRSE